jgi:PAS domain S-box-containing protein
LHHLGSDEADEAVSVGTVRRAPVAPMARRTIGVLSPVVGGFYFGALINGMARAARAAGHRVVAVQTYPAGLDRERYPDESVLDAPVALGAVDGLVIVGRAVSRARVADAHRWGVPVVLVSEEPSEVEDVVVLPDNRGGTVAAVDHLVAHGHTRIGFVGNLTQQDMRERYGAYRDALAAHGITAEDTWWFEASDNHEQGGADAAARLLAAGTPTTVATDRNAVGFQRALRAAGLHLPKDQAVVGFDHAESGARVSPRLTTIDPRFDRVGETAVQLLVARMRGDDVVAGEYRATASLVVRESCGCSESAAGAMPGEEPPSARAGLRRLATVAFGGPAGPVPARRLGVAPHEAWWRAITEVLDTAVERGSSPARAVLARIADLTSAMQPHPEALEQLVIGVRALEAEMLETLPQGVHPDPLRRAVTEVLVALSRGCLRSTLARTGQLERVIVDQYEVDMDLLRGDGASPRALGWLPRGVRGHACLGLWLGADHGYGDRELEIVGVHDTTGTLSRLVGLRTTASQFPPPALTRAGSIGVQEITFVVPVTFGSSDWGLLAIDGTAESRTTSARARFNHWAALLAVALDQERLLTSLREQRRALEQAASRERSLAETLRASEERYALASAAAQDGTWDWDVSAGRVYYSTRWKQTLGYAEHAIGDSPSEWLDRIHPADRDEVSAAIAAKLAGSAADSSLELEHRVRTASGDYRWMLCRAVTVLDDAGQPGRLVGALVDVTDRKEAEMALRRDALRDPETGLVNRALLVDRLAAAVARTRRTDEYDCAVVLLRIAPGAPVPGQGRADADADGRRDLRREVVRRLRRSLREGDTAARTAEDEFVVLLDDVGGTGVPVRVAQVLDQLRTDLGPRVALGVLHGIRGYRDSDDVLRDADITLLRDSSAPARSERPGSVVR